MTILFGILCWAAIAENKELQVPDLATVENQVLKYRRKIQRGHVVFRQKTYIKKIYMPRFDRATTIWFDGKKVRNDNVFRYTDQPEDTPLHREVTCRNCEKEGYWVDYIDRRFPQGEYAVTMTNMVNKTNPESFGVIHPRLLGMVLESVPNLATSRAHLESVIGRPDRENLRIQRPILKGEECWKITYKLNNAIFRVWISPHQGPSIVRIEGVSDITGQHVADSFESDLRKYRPSGIWYPQSSVYERRVNGESVEKEVTEVQVLSLNEPVDSVNFKLAGMNIPVDRRVHIFDKRKTPAGMKYWNGKELVKKKTLPNTPLKSRRYKPSSRRWLLTVNAGLFALIGVLLLWRWWRNRKAA